MSRPAAIHYSDTPVTGTQVAVCGRRVEMYVLTDLFVEDVTCQRCRAVLITRGQVTPAQEDPNGQRNETAADPHRSSPAKG